VTLFKRVIFILVSFGTTPILCAVELSPGVVYEAGTIVQSSELGLSLTIPSGWQGAWPQGVDAFIIQKQGAQDIILVQGDQVDKQTIVSMMNQPIALEQGITLIPVGKAVEKSGIISGKYSVSGQYANADAEIKSLIGKHGVSVALIGLGFSAGEPRRTLAKLTETLKFMPPRQASQNQSDVSSGGSGQAWSDYMRGRYIVYYYTGSGYHEEDHIWLCSDGSYYRSNSSGGFGGGASGAYGGKASGRWQVTGTLPETGVLILTSGPGVFEGSTTFGDWTEARGPSQATFELSLQNDKLHLNGTQWFRDANQRCQ
jgi:hypothetical protein